MPFVTETLWQQLPKRADQVRRVQPRKHAKDAFFFPVSLRVCAGAA